jgi:ribosomal protein S18 acetylase RimI-like enzyme
MAEEILLRAATVADADDLAALWMVSFPDKFGPILGEQGERVLGDWLRLSRRHLQTTTVAEVGGVIAGFIILETPAAPGADSGRWLWHALQLHNGILGALRSFVLILLIDNDYRAGQDEIYIEMLGVHPEWRGRGLAQQLIAHAEAVAQAESARRLTLNVVSNNFPALRLYQKLGFEVIQTHRSRILKWLIGHGEYYRMVKLRQNR